MSNPEGASHDEFYKSLLGDFLGESEHLLVSLNGNLQKLNEWVRSLKDDRQQPCNDSLLSELFRSAHSFKGLSNMLGLEEIERLVDHIEKVFDAARKDLLVVTGDVVDLLFDAIDRLGNLVDALKDPDAPPVDYETINDRLAQLLRSCSTESKDLRQIRTERTLENIESQVAKVLNGMSSSDVLDAPPDASRNFNATAKASDNSNQTAVPNQTLTNAVSQTNVDGHELFAEISDDADMSSRFMSIFIDETEIALDQLTETLLALEGGGSSGELKQLLVISHKIKGSAAAIGLNRAAKLSHLMEDLLQNMGNSDEKLSPEVTDALLKCVDELRSYVQHLKQGSIPRDHFPDLAMELLKARQQGESVDNVPPSVGGDSSDKPRQEHVEPTVSQSVEQDSTQEASEKPSAPDSLPEMAPQPVGESSEEVTLIAISDELRANAIAAAPIGLPLFTGVATFQPNLALVSLKAELLHEKLSNLGDVCYFDPPPEELDNIETLDCIRFGLATERSEHEIRVALKTAGVIGSVVEPLVSGSDAPNVAAQQSASASNATDFGAPLKTPTESSSVAPAKDTQQEKSKTTSDDNKQPSRPADTHNRPTETLRVDVDRLDQLMNLAGQLVVNKARFAQISDSLRGVVGNKRSVMAMNNVITSLSHIASLEEIADREALEAELTSICAQARRIHNQLEPMQREVESFQQMHASVNELEEAVHQLDRVADEIQKNVMDTRMVPIGPLFTRFHRVVRDITRASGKAIRLAIHGEKTELDKRMIDELGDPLIHMIRNSADHGIEPPDVRARAGKPAEGTITLHAFHRGNSILIQISDDGRGLDPDHILSKAIERGLVSSREAEQMTVQQIHQLIWQPGFSTAQEVTEVSGRGVGMDIVKSRVEALNGIVELESMPGQGMTITIKLPLTLAILPSLMVEVSGDVFAMPMESVSEIVRIRREEIATVHGKLAAQIRGRVVSIVDLDDVFQWRHSSTNPTDRSSGLLTLVIVGEGEAEIGLAIDRVIGEEDVVIKSMADNYKNVPGIAGASVLGSGRVSLILDMAAVIAMAAYPTATANSM